MIFTKFECLKKTINSEKKKNHGEKKPQTITAVGLIDQKWNKDYTKNICNTLCCDGLKSCSDNKAPLLKRAHVVDEIKIEQFLHQFTCCIC